MQDISPGLFPQTPSLDGNLPLCRSIKEMQFYVVLFLESERNKRRKKKKH